MVWKRPKFFSFNFSLWLPICFPSTNSVLRYNKEHGYLTIDIPYNKQHTMQNGYIKEPWHQGLTSTSSWVGGSREYLVDLFWDCSEGTSVPCPGRQRISLVGFPWKRYGSEILWLPTLFITNVHTPGGETGSSEFSGRSIRVCFAGDVRVLPENTTTYEIFISMKTSLWRSQQTTVISSSKTTRGLPCAKWRHTDNNQDHQETDMMVLEVSSRLALVRYSIIYLKFKDTGCIYVHTSSLPIVLQ